MQKRWRTQNPIRFHRKKCKKIGSFSLIERVILSAGAMLIFSVSFQILMKVSIVPLDQRSNETYDQMPEGEESGGTLLDDHDKNIHGLISETKLPPPPFQAAINLTIFP